MIRRLDSRKMRSQHRREAGLRRGQHAFAAAALGQDVASAVDQPEPEAAGAPIHRDISGFDHIRPRHRLMAKTPSRDNETMPLRLPPRYRLLRVQTSPFY